MPPLVTFVIPTLGRKTLARALNSLLSQTDQDWEAVVIYDGRVANGPSHDPRFWYLETEKNSAGMTRNVGLDWFRSNSESAWVAFLDDDDELEPTYVAHLRQHEEDFPWAEVVVFRMNDPRMGVLPREDGRLAWSQVGISFALNARVAETAKFIKEDWSAFRNEDWEMISSLVTAGRRIFISPHIDYLVKGRHG